MIVEKFLWVTIFDDDVIDYVMIFCMEEKKNNYNSFLKTNEQTNEKNIK